MFQDEARFGRISEPKRCWCPKGIRPEVGCQRIREYTYLYGAFSPKDGDSYFLILPNMTKEAMQIFLDELSKAYPDDYILLICDGASCHSDKLDIPSNIEIVKIPPYCPQINPSENMWEEIREKLFPNIVFNSMDAVEKRIMQACSFYQENKNIVQSITNFNWIKCHL